MKVDAKYLAYAKAIVAGVTSVLTVIGVIISVATDGAISGDDWVTILATIIGGGVTTGTVYRIPNVKKGDS